MDTRSFEDHLDRLGGDFARWPADLRQDAERLLDESAEARGLKAAIDKVEHLLRATPVPLASPGAIAARASQHGQIGRTRNWVRAAACGAATAVVLALGIFVGNDRLTSHDESPDQVVAGALDPTGTVDVD